MRCRCYYPLPALQKHLNAFASIQALGASLATLAKGAGAKTLALALLPALPEGQAAAAVAGIAIGALLGAYESTR